MVIDAAAPVAFLPPAANFAVRYEVRIGIAGAGSAVYGRLKLALNQPVVSKKVLDAEGEELEVVARHDGVHVLGENALNIGGQVRVKAKLQNSSGPGLAGELCIEHLIRPGSEPASPLNAFQEIGPPMPAAAPQSGLVDQIGTVSHR
jgi:hypothetical protein